MNDSFLILLCLAVILWKSLSILLEEPTETFEDRVKVTKKIHNATVEIETWDVPACQGTHAHNPNSNLWKAMRDFSLAVEGLDAPIFVHGGTLLGLVRSCTTFGDDLDFIVERKYYADNFQRIANALRKAGFRYKWFFPGANRSYPNKEQTEVLGFEASWVKYSVKLDLYGVDIGQSQFMWGLWDPENVYNHCPIRYEATFRIFSWHGVPVKVPEAPTRILKELYGELFMQPRRWRWNIEPFTVGPCNRTQAS